jgi:hypothetical protein
VTGLRDLGVLNFPNLLVKVNDNRNIAIVTTDRLKYKRSPFYNLATHMQGQGIRWLHGMGMTPSDVRLYVMVGSGAFEPNSDGRCIYPIETERVQSRFRANMPNDGIEVWFDNSDVTRILDTTRALDPYFGANRLLFIHARFDSTSLTGVYDPANVTGTVDNSTPNIDYL